MFFFSFLGPKMRNSLIFYLTFYTSILTLRKLNQLKIKRWPFVRSHINYPHIHPTFYLRVDDSSRFSFTFMEEIIKLYNKFPWISKEFSRKKLQKKFSHTKYVLEIREISWKEKIFLILLYFNLFMKFHVEILVFSWTKI